MEDSVGITVSLFPFCGHEVAEWPSAGSESQDWYQMLYSIYCIVRSHGFMVKVMIFLRCIV